MYLPLKTVLQYSEETDTIVQSTSKTSDDVEVEASGYTGREINDTKMQFSPEKQVYVRMNIGR